MKLQIYAGVLAGLAVALCWLLVLFLFATGAPGTGLEQALVWALAACLLLSTVTVVSLFRRERRIERDHRPNLINLLLEVRYLDEGEPG